MKLVRLMFVMVFLASCLVPAGAEWQRTIETEDTLTVGRCKWQVDVGVEYMKFPESLGDLDYGEVGVLARFGVMENLDIAAYIPGVYTKNGDEEYGLGDVAFMAKYMILDDIDDFIGLSILGTVKSSSGDEGKGLGTGTINYTIGVALSKVFGDLTLVGNLGYTYVDEDGAAIEYEDLFLYGIEAIYRVCDLYDVHGFVLGSTKPVEGAEGVAYAGIGMTIYPAWEFVSFQFDGAAGLTDDTADYKVEAKARFLF